MNGATPDARAGLPCDRSVEVAAMTPSAVRRGPADTPRGAGAPQADSPRYAARTRGSSSIALASSVIVIRPESIT